ncbi:MAG: hypothetical protein AUG89_00165 [Acidobacteria bacterium 13_1_20CM_4_56_7]|nr:MAG: hypothetical protein AUG89_00165 [Acidobacteria bacterium 13_1_20CM_4_56_7]
MRSRAKGVNDPGQRVTLKFIAEYLGVSPTTVSVVLTNSPLASTIAKQTQARIWEAVQKFQYRPNVFARYLQAKRTYSVAVLVPEIGDEFSALLINGIESKLAEAKFNYFVESHGFAPEEKIGRAQISPMRPASLELLSITIRSCLPASVT